MERTYVREADTHGTNRTTRELHQASFRDMRPRQIFLLQVGRPKREADLHGLAGVPRKQLAGPAMVVFRSSALTRRRTAEEPRRCWRHAPRTRGGS
jgi:hypothetical protein